MGHGCGAAFDNTHRGFVQHAQKYGMVALVVLSIWALTGFVGTWAFWVIGIMGVKLAMHARRVYRGRDDEPMEDEPAPEDDFVIM